MKKQSWCALAVAWFALWNATAAAQSFPSRPIELVVHTTPGGGSDMTARTVADIIARQKLLPQPVLVLNRPGGGGALAQGYVASKKGDPHTLLTFAATIILSVPIRTGTDLGLDKFHPLALFGFDLTSLTVKDDAPYKTVADLVNAAKAHPKSINIAVGSIGATGHYFIYQLEQLTGARFNVVAIKSGAEAVTAVAGGHLHATAENLTEVMPLVETGKLRILAIPAARRVSAIPNVPTLKEQGMDIHVGTGRGFAAPAGISKEAAALWEDTLAKVWKSPTWREAMTRHMFEETYMNAEETRRYLTARQGEMAKFLGEMGLVQKKP